MLIQNITNAYIDEYLVDKDIVRYESSYPSLFVHYFKYWGDRGTFYPVLNNKETIQRVALLEKTFSQIEGNFARYDLDISNQTVILFVGQNYTNGHAYLDGKVSKVFLPVEGYETDAQVKAFVSHEILHGIHYQNQSSFYFNNKREKEMFSRLLLTEGLATLLSKEIMNLNDREVLWADFLSDLEWSVWKKKCEQEFRELCGFAYENFYNSENSQMFYTGWNKGKHVNREGYYLGMRVLEEVIKSNFLEPKDLLYAERDEIEKWAIGILREYM